MMYRTGFFSKREQSERRRNTLQTDVKGSARSLEASQMLNLYNQAGVLSKDGFPAVIAPLGAKAHIPSCCICAESPQGDDIIDLEKVFKIGRTL